MKEALDQKKGYSDSYLKEPEVSFESLMENFMKGSQINTIIADSEDCISANKYLFGNVSRALAEYTKKPTINNFFEIAQTFGNFTPAIKYCFGSCTEASEAFFQHFMQFKSLSKFWNSLVFNVENDLLIFGIQVNKLKNLLFAH